MGKKVDSFVLTAGITILLYLYFRGAIHSRMLCIIFAMLGCMILRRTWKKLRNLFDHSSIMQKKKLRRHS